MQDSLISEDCVVLVRRDKVYRAFRLKRGRKVKFDRLSFYPDAAFGHPYGSSFEVQGQQLVEVEERREVEGMSSGADNRAIFDDGSAQRLSVEDISEMKGEGVSGQGIVQSMIEHSVSFKDKTKFSQEKYIKKKEKRHVSMVIILKPSTRALCEMYYAKGPSKICHLRIDALAQMLTMCNVHAHSNIITMETCQGLLVGAVLERLGGHGNLVQVFFGDFPVRIALDHFGHLSPDDLSILREYPLHRVGPLLGTEVARHSTVWPAPMEQEKVEGVSGAGPQPHARRDEGGALLEDLEADTELGGLESGCGVENEDTEFLDLDQAARPAKRARLDVEGEGGQDGGERGIESGSEMTVRQSQKSEVDFDAVEKERRRREREERYKMAEEILRSGQMDGLLIASRFHPGPLLMSLVEFLAPSRPFVVYCHIMEPLVQCYKSLKEQGIGFNLQLSETWLRHYQVLPQRTHPEMNMDGRSGYLLTGTTVSRT